MRIFRIIFLVLLLAVFTALVMQNTEVVTVQFLSLQVEMSLIILLLITAVLGFLGGYITAKLPTYQERRKAKKAAKQQMKEMKRQEKEAKRQKKKGNQLPPVSPIPTVQEALSETPEAEPIPTTDQPTNK